jgi:hypothetical protein
MFIAFSSVFRSYNLKKAVNLPFSQITGTFIVICLILLKSNFLMPWYSRRLRIRGIVGGFLFRSALSVMLWTNIMRALAACDYDEWFWVSRPRVHKRETFLPFFFNMNFQLLSAVLAVSGEETSNETQLWRRSVCNKSKCSILTCKKHKECRKCSSLCRK